MPRESAIRKLFLFLFTLLLLTGVVPPIAQAAVGDLGPEIVGIASSDNFSCMNAKSGEVYCWGQSFDSNLGTGIESDNAVPHKVYEITDSIKIDTGEKFACSLSKTGIVSCWGNNEVGQIGDGYLDPNDRIFPSYVAGLRNIKDISLGDKHACALNASGNVFCWGDNKFGQLGNLTIPTSNLVQTIINSNVPIEVSVPEPLIAITTGSNHTCGLSKKGFVYCWGSNLVGQLGIGLQNISINKAQAVPALSGVTKVKSHFDSTCANTSAAGLYCWGQGMNGELGETEKINRYLPRLMSGTYSVTNASTNVATAYTYATSLTNFAFGRNGGCGIDGKSGNGYLVCWGTNTGYEPTSVQALDVVLGRNHGCMITITYTVACWGSNLYGQTGANLKSATWQKYAVLKGIPEWRNYISSWGISYVNNVATITWTGAAESKFALNVEPFGTVCEVTSVFNCQVGILESNTTYKVMLIARGSTTAASRLASFSFTTGNLISAIDEYNAKLLADAKAAEEKARLAAIEARKYEEAERLAIQKDSYVAICEVRKKDFVAQYKQTIEKPLIEFSSSQLLLEKTTLSLKTKIKSKTLKEIEILKLKLSKQLGEFKMLLIDPVSYTCSGNVTKDDDQLTAIESTKQAKAKSYLYEINKSINLWKTLLTKKQ